MSYKKDMKKVNDSIIELNDILRRLKEAKSKLKLNPDNKELQEEVFNLFNDLKKEFKFTKSTYYGLIKEYHTDTNNNVTKESEDAIREITSLNSKIRDLKQRVQKVMGNLSKEEETKTTEKEENNTKTEQKKDKSNIKDKKENTNALVNVDNDKSLKNNNIELIPGTNILKPRVRGINESDEDYKNYLDNYYKKEFSKDGNTNDTKRNDLVTVDKDNDLEETKTTEKEENNTKTEQKKDKSNIKDKDKKEKTNDTKRNDLEETVPEYEENNVKESKTRKWLKYVSGVAGFGVGTGLALTAVGGPVVAVGLSVVSTINIVSNSANIINNIITKHNIKKGNYEKDENGNVILDEDGYPIPASTWIDSIKSRVPEPIRRASAIITGHTNKESWNWFVNGVSLGYAAGNIYKAFNPHNTTTSGMDAKLNTDPNTNPTPSTTSVSNTTPTVQVDPNSHWDLSNIDTVYMSSDKVGGPLNPLEGHYNDAIVRRILDTPNGPMADLAVAGENGLEDLAWVTVDSIKTLGKRL